MSVSSELYKVNVVGDGSTPSIAFNRKVFNSTDIKGFSYDTTTSVETALINGTDFTVTGAGDTSSGVTITPASSIATGTNWVLYSDAGNAQGTTLTTAGEFPAKSLEYAFDKLSIGTQEADGKADRALKLPVSDTASADLPNKTLRASKYLGFDSNGDPTALAGGTATDSGDISYLAADSGATSRTVEARLRDAISVKDYGATGDGTTDDLAAIKSCIEDRATGAIVEIPSGTYYMVGELDTTLTSNLHIVMAPGAKLLGDTDNQPMLTVRASNDYAFSLTGGQIDNGDRTFVSGDQSGSALSLVRVDDVMISGCIFGRSSIDYDDTKGDTGIELNQCNRVTVHGCTFYGQADAGIYSFGANALGESDDGGSLSIIGNHFYNCDIGVTIKREQGEWSVTGNTFRRCRNGVATLETNGIKAGESGVISANTFKYVEAYPIRLQTQSNCVVQGNHIEDFGYDLLDSATTGYGIWMRGAKDCVVTGNIIRFDKWTPASTHYGFNIGDYVSSIDGSGTHTGSGNAATLTDSAQAWVVDALIGLTVKNTTDGSEGTITDNDATTVTATLSGGSEDDWDASDAYQIVWKSGGNLIAGNVLTDIYNAFYENSSSNPNWYLDNVSTGHTTMLANMNTSSISRYYNGTIYQTVQGTSTEIDRITPSTGRLRLVNAEQDKSIHRNAGVLTIATGAVTATGSYHKIDTEGAAGTDDLDTISGGETGQRLIIRPNAGTRTVVAKDGTGNLELAGDFTMDNEHDILELIYDGDLAVWVEISRSGNAA